MGVEQANRAEELAEARGPLLDKFLTFNRIDHREAGPAAPAQDLHLRLVVRAVGAGAVHHVDYAGARHDGAESLAFVPVARVVPMLLNEGSYRFRSPGRVITMGVEPVQYRAGPLQAGRIDEFIQGFPVHLHGVVVGFPGGTGPGIDVDRVIAGQGGHNTGFPLVGAPHHGKGRDTHGVGVLFI